MGAAAQLYRETRHGDHPHALAVLLAEQRHRAGGNRLLRRAFLGFHRLVPEDMLVDEAFNLGQLPGGDGLVMGDVEPQPIRRHQRSGLPHMRADHGAQRRVQQVRRRMVAANIVAARGVHLGGYLVAELQCALADRRDVHARPVRLQAHHVLDGAVAVAGDQPAGVRNLAAGLQVERRLTQDDIPRLSRGQHVGSGQRRAARLPPEKMGHPGLPARRLVADERLLSELRLTPCGEQVRPGAHRDFRVRPVAEGGPGSRTGALRLQRLLECVPIDPDSPRLRQVLDEVERHAVGVVQPERGVAGDHLRARLRLGERRFQAGQAVAQHPVELLLLAAHDRGNDVAVGVQLRIRAFHLADHHAGQLVQERLGQAKLLAVPHRPAHDLAQHVAPPFVGGDYAVGDQERHGAQVVGDDAQRDVAGVVRRPARQRSVLRARPPCDGRQQGREEVGVVVGQLVLQHRDDALQPHAGIDGGGRQRRQRPVGLPLELHEDVVPDFDVAVAVAIDAAARGRGARQVVAAVVVDLRAAAARPGVAHRPEVLRGPQLRNAFRRHQLPPDGVRLVVARHAALALEHGGVEPLGRKAPGAGQQLPRERDGIGLEVVAEREVAEHFEERVVAQRRAHVLQVVVLAADAHAFLRRRGALVVARLPAEEQVLELVHAGVCEQQRGIVGRHERRAGNHAVSPRFEERQKTASDFAGSHRLPILSQPPTAPSFGTVGRSGRAVAPQRGQHGRGVESLADQLLIHAAQRAAVVQRPVQAPDEHLLQQRLLVELVVHGVNRAPRQVGADPAALQLADCPEAAVHADLRGAPGEQPRGPLVVEGARPLQAFHRAVDLIRAETLARQPLPHLCRGELAAREHGESRRVRIGHCRRVREPELDLSVPRPPPRRPRCVRIPGRRT